MKLAGDVLFNLLLNTFGSFWLGLAVALVVLRISRGRAGTLAEYALLLPFAKVVWDLAHGIPKSSFLWASEHGVQQRLGSFRVGVGATPWGPVLRGQIWAHHAHGASPQSLPDILARALSHRVWLYGPAALGFGLFAASLAKLGSSLLSFARFQSVLQQTRANSRLEERSLGFRTLRIYISPSYEGVAFAGGLFRPYIVLPESMLQRLSADERRAVFEHELAHVAHFDVALLVPLQCLHDLLWYVPGSSWLLRRLRQLLEFRADDAAVRAGVSPRVLVSALLAVAELSLVDDPGPHVLAVSRAGSVLRARVERLLSPPPVLRVRGKLAVVAHVLVVAWFMLGALQAVACGNHP